MIRGRKLLVLSGIFYYHYVCFFFSVRSKRQNGHDFKTDGNGKMFNITIVIMILIIIITAIMITLKILSLIMVMTAVYVMEAMVKNYCNK